jgi:hypothetical protein
MDIIAPVIRATARPALTGTVPPSARPSGQDRVAQDR